MRLYEQGRTVSSLFLHKKQKAPADTGVLYTPDTQKGFSHKGQVILDPLAARSQKCVCNAAGGIKGRIIN